VTRFSLKSNFCALRSFWAGFERLRGFLLKKTTKEIPIFFGKNDEIPDDLLC
jgi:hypothetical protein